ncbi:MAG: DNA mismatch repair endonuclease MutL [Candidatus Lokiarchaeota archaeon]|nr:DNA mismatch repair endonuclease MutL [Candidatus Lokiarchaeota archaeon]
MTEIIKLTEDLINKIAAGEVIERPASIVKELIENSIDAGADNINILIKDGGKKEIIIEDNGKGIPKDQVELAFERHSTSKIKSLNDLSNINTLGFRGEALSSIVAVSRLEIETKTAISEVGIKLKFEGGKLLEKKEVAMNQGTRIKISDLFFNTPARKKFMKTTETEFSHIIDLIENYALIYPNIYFSLKHNSKEILVSPQLSTTIDDLTYLENISYILGKDIAKEMIQVKNSMNDTIKLTAFIAKPSIYRKNSDRISIFVNKRYIKSNMITNAVRNAYKNLLLSGYYPIALISLEINPTKIDVNVHPTKREIRFPDEDALFQFISESIRKKLEEINIIRVIEDKKIIKVKQSIKKDSDQVNITGSLENWINEPVESRSIIQSEQFETVQDEQTTKIPKLKYIGQIFDIYLIFQGKNEMYIVDQHAAAERIQYERIIDHYKKAKIKTQILLSPISFELPSKESQQLLESNNLEKLSKFGFEVAHFGGNTFVVKKVPVLLKQIKDEKSIIEFLNDLDISKTFLDDRMFKTMACHSSLRGGEPITDLKAQKLLEELRKCKNSFSCCHGRPTIISIDEKFLEKKFQRKL